MMSASQLRDALCEPWRHGDHLDCQDLVLNERLILDGLTVRGVDLSGATLNSGLSAKGTTFRGLAWFQDARIAASVDLTDVRCRSDLRLDGLHCAALTLSGGYFEGVVSLDAAQIGHAALDHCVFLANLSMSKTRVERMLDLSHSALMGGVWSDQAIIGDLRMGQTETHGRAWSVTPDLH